MKCPDCHGTGLLDEREQPPLSCPICHGSGKAMTIPKCKECNSEIEADNLDDFTALVKTKLCENCLNRLFKRTVNKRLSSLRVKK